MAIRRPGPDIPVAARTPAGEAPSLGQVLGQLGAVGTNRMQLATSLLAQLGAAGFGGGSFKALGAQLQHALAGFQRASGLPVTGKLDSATLSILENLGFTPKGAPAPGAGGDGFVGGDKGRTHDGEGRALPQGEAPSAPGELKAGLLAFTKGAMAASLKPGSGGGERAGTAAPPSPENAAAGASGAPQKEAQAAAARTDAAPARGTPAETADLSSRIRADTLGTKNPDGRGADVGDLRAEKGRGKQGDGEGRFGGGDEADGSPELEDDGSGARSDDESGNAPSGDEDFENTRRGEAALDDGSDDDAGYFEIPGLDVQLRSILKVVVRDVVDDNRPATYTLEHVFLRPGIYGRRQQPEILLKAEVHAAQAFDPAWDDLLEGLRTFARRHGSDAEPPSRGELEMALRLARYRED